MLNAGALDPAFGTGGLVTTDLGGLQTVDGAVLQTVNNTVKIIVAGTSTPTTPAGSDSIAYVARYNPDGSLDATFGDLGPSSTAHLGWTQIDLGPGADHMGGVALTPDNKIVLAGWHDTDNGAGHISVARLNSDGSRDAGFGTGVIELNLATAADVSAVAVQPDGNILLAGDFSSFIGLPNSAEYVARIQGSGDVGSLDASFGERANPGIQSKRFLLGSQLNSLALDNAGNILVAGRVQGLTGSFFALWRLDAGGNSDTTFGLGGEVFTSIGSSADARAVAVDPSSGDIVLAGRVRSSVFTPNGDDFGVARYLPGGSFDLSFGGPGFHILKSPSNDDDANAVAVQADGKILIGGKTNIQPASGNPHSEFQLVRVSTDGVPDATFGNGGVVTTDFGGAAQPSDDEGQAVLVQPDGNIVVAGISNQHIALARYLAGPIGRTLVALTTDNKLATFDSLTPGSVQSVPISGVLPTDRLQTIAFRPDDGQLYGVSFAHLYTLDRSSGVASLIGNPNAALSLDGSVVAASFDPTSRNLRIITDGQQNLAISPVTGQVVNNGTAPHYVTGDVHFGRSPNLRFLAYTNQVLGADSTSLYGIDAFPQGSDDNLVTVGVANSVRGPDGGELFTVAPTGKFDAFTIGGADNEAFVLVTNSGVDNLTEINLVTGQATSLMGSIGVEATALAMVPANQTLPPPPAGPGIPFGTYIENFSDRTDPSKSGFDSTGTFQHRIGHVITNPADVVGPNYEIRNSSQGGHELSLNTGLDTITFPKLASDEEIEFAKVDVSGGTAGGTAVDILGTNGIYRLPVSAGTSATVSVGFEHLLQNGLELGPIRGIELFGAPGSSFRNVTILVAPAISTPPPLAEDVSKPVLPGVETPIDVLANDQAADGGPLTIVSVTTPSHGSAVVSGDVVNYTPISGYLGLDEFNYTIRDQHGGTATAKVTVHVQTLPTAQSHSYDRPHGSTGPFTVAAPGLLDGAVDPAGGRLTAVLVGGAANGRVTINPDDGSFTYTPTTPGGLVIDDFFTFKVTDGIADSEVANAGIFVPNQVPIAANREINHFHSDDLHAGTTVITGTVTATDADGDPLTFFKVKDPDHGTVTVNADGSFDYTPGAVTDSFTFRASDGYAFSAEATVTIHDFDAAPTANDDGPIQLNLADTHFQETGNKGIRSTISVLANDVDNNPGGGTAFLTAVLVAQPSKGIADFLPDGRFVYTPLNFLTLFDNAAFDSYDDSFTYVASDGLQQSEVATVHVHVVAKPQDNPPPFTTGIGQVLTVDSPGLFEGIRDGFGNAFGQGPFRWQAIIDTDAHTDPLTGNPILPTVRGGRIELDPLAGSFQYQPPPGFSGVDSLNGGFHIDFLDPADTVPFLHKEFIEFPILSCLVTNGPPVPVNDEYSIHQSSGPEAIFLEVDAAHGVLANDSNPDMLPFGDQGLKATLLSFNGPGQLNDDQFFFSEPGINTNGAFSYLPPADFTGDVTFTYRVDYPYLQGTAIGTVTIHVLPPLPNFVISVVPGTSVGPFLRQGGSVSFSITATPSSGFQSLINLGVSNLPAHVIASFVPASVLPGQISMLILSADFFAVPASYDIAVRGTSGSLVHDTDRSVYIYPGNIANFADQEGQVLLLTSPSGTILQNYRSVQNPDPTGGLPAGTTPADFPRGFFTFELSNLMPGAHVAVTLDLPQDAGVTRYFKFGPTKDPQGTILPAHWYDFSYDPVTDTGAEIQGNQFNSQQGIQVFRIVLHLVDGGRGDDDLTSNGMILDPSGLLVETIPVRPEARFVIALYQTLLNRQPEPAGLTAWVNVLDAGASRFQVVQGIYNSPEHRGIQVDHFYATYLHRAADPAGRVAWVNELLAGVSETDVALGFLQSAEYRASHADTASFVQGLYADVLNRPPDPLGQSALQRFIEQGTTFLPAATLRGLVARGALTSPEAYVRAIDQCYRNYLHRPADLPGQAVYLALMEHQVKGLERTAEAILASQEFFTKSTRL